MKKKIRANQLFYILSIFFIYNGVFAQKIQDSIKKNIYKKSVSLPDAQSIQELYTYDPDTGLFYLTKKVGDFNISYPWVLTPEEYYKRILRQSINKKFKENNQAISGKGKDAEKLRKNLLPTYYVNSKFFESIFGGKTVDIQPTGSIGLDLGLRYTKRDNPAIPVRNRSNTSLLFDQKIQMGLKGKIGTRLNIDFNYDTQSTFDFNNQIKLNYTPTEDDIIQNIELGNVSMKTNNSLISGAQSLFGLKTELQFGKTYITGVFAEQKSGMRTIQAQGDEVITDFEASILDYEENKNFFLAQYFRQHYDEAVKNYPFINSTARITRIEVWKTNRNTQTENIRNIVAIQDLAENQILGLNNLPPGFVINSTSPPDNSVNKLDPALIAAGGGVLNPAIRDIFSVSQGFTGITPVNGKDYISLENAVKLDSTQYKLYPQLGYITLKQSLNPDEVLAVAFEYTINGQVYRVGEFSDNGIVYPQTLVVKLLKSNIVSTNEPTWVLMMKNIYKIDAFDIKPDDFRLNILYVNPTPLNYITGISGTPLPADVDQRILLNVFNMDRLNFQKDPIPKGDGFFDFVPGITIDPHDGRIIFTSTEPFGKYLFEKLRLSPTEDYNNPATWNANQKHYVYNELYQLSRTQAEQYTAKNKFILKGKYKTAGGDGIPIGGFNIPRGSVTVTAGGRTLVEGVDYVVNYQMGRVNIINPSVKSANVPVQVSVEQNSVFQQTTKIFKGINVEHKFNENFVLGGTYMSFKEKPLSWKSSYGNEPLNNTLIGFNGRYSTKLPFLTRWVNRLPNIETDAESNFSIQAEAAYLFPGLSKVSDVNGRSTTYVEDFEGSQTFIDLRSQQAWHLSGVPARFPESALIDNLDAGKNRAKLSWFIIDPVFYSNNAPTDIDANEISKEETRQIQINEIFDQDVPAGYPTSINPLNLVFYPKERGPYNFDTNLDSNTGKLLNPQQRWGGIMRYLQTNDFEQANVEYIELWVMDPYFNNPTPPPGGKLYIDLGYMSEDILPDGRKQYENGLPGDGSDNNTVLTNVARVPAHQSLVYAFSNDANERQNQDVGLDGLPDSRERTFFASFLNSLPGNLQNIFNDDPAADDYQNYLQTQGGIIERYKNFNGTEGNTPIDVANNNTNNGVTSSNTFPDVEDIDRDQSMNTVESYFEYALDIKPNMTVNNPFVSDIREKTVTLPNQDQQTSRWIQFKIPIEQFSNVVGNITDFRSIKFMRMYLTGFQEDRLVLRLAALNLVRGDWKKYKLTMEPGDINPNDDGTAVEATSVSIQDNYNRQPIPYVLPPGIEREQVSQQNSTIRLNEQALSLKVCGLEVKDGRGVYKYNSVDMRQFKRLEMFIHAEKIDGQTPLQDGDAEAFIRFGNDLTDNYYEVRIPLKVTPFGTSDPEEIWPLENRIDLKLELLNKIKLELIKTHSIGTSPTGVFFPESFLDPEAAGKPNELLIGMKGNPNYGDVKVIMVGVRNATSHKICGEYWFNELRLSEMQNKGGWAGNTTMDANLADFATLSFTGGISTEGFGGLEQGPMERNLEDAQHYNFNTTVNVGKLLPKKWNVNIPVNYTVSEEFIRPKYDPIWRDIPLQDRLNIANGQEKDSILNVAQSYKRHRGITLSGVKKNYSSQTAKSTSNTSGKTQKKKTKKHYFFDIENFTFDFAYNELYHSDYEIQSNSDQTAKLGVNYNYSFKELSFSPFKKSKKLKSKKLRFIKDFNFNLMPSSITVTSNINRRFNNMRFRQIIDYGLEIPPLQNRDYRMDWGYTVNYNPTKSITTSFGITHNRSVKNYLLPDGSPDYNNEIWSGFFDIGSPLIHNQNINLSYNLPFKKFPWLNFINSTYVYNGTFEWQRRSQALADVGGYDLGNTIQNSNSHQLNTTLDLRKLYREFGITKLKNKLLGKSRKSGNKKKRRVKSKENQVAGKNKETNKKNKSKKEVADYSQPGVGGKLLGHLLEVLTGFQNFKVNYRQNNGIMLPGYLQSVGFAGTFNPSIPFALGWDDDNVRYEAAKRGWLTQYPDFNLPYLNTFTEEISFQGMYKPFKSFTLTLKAQKSFMENVSEQFNAVGNNYNAMLPTTTGSHSVSTVMVKTAFENIALENSPAYNRMLNSRLQIARRLASARGIAIPATGYPDGYGPLQTEVVLYSFMSGYLDQNPDKIGLSPFKNLPIPNWRLKISGLSSKGFLKNIFKNLSIEHSYKSDYTINQFSNNLQTFNTPGARDAAGNFYFDYVMDNVTLTEAFNPLIKINMEMKNSLKLDVAFKKDRAISLNLNNYTLSEVAGKEYVVGLGYRLKDITLPLNLAGRRITFTSDLILKLDASIRDNITIIRSLADNNNQITAGQTMYNLKFSADYALTKNLSAILFYNHSYSKFAISTNYPFTNIRGGFTLKYNFGN